MPKTKSAQNKLKMPELAIKSKILHVVQIWAQTEQRNCLNRSLIIRCPKLKVLKTIWKCRNWLYNQKSCMWSEYELKRSTGTPWIQGRAKLMELSLVTHVPSGPIGCAWAGHFAWQIWGGNFKQGEKFYAPRCRSLIIRCPNLKVYKTIWKCQNWL